VPYAEIAVRAVLVIVFAVAVVGKVRQPREFVASLRGFGVLPSSAVRPVAAVVAVLEVATVVLLLVPAALVAGYALAAGLLAGFAGAMAVSLRRGARPVCRCFGGRGAAVGPVHVGRNAGLVAAAVAGAVMSMVDGAALEPGPVVLAAATGVVVAAIVVRLDDLVALFAPIPTQRSR
jgi:hypothetical protein